MQEILAWVTADAAGGGPAEWNLLHF